jgi:hypothetical protein
MPETGSFGTSGYNVASWATGTEQISHAAAVKVNMSRISAIGIAMQAVGVLIGTGMLVSGSHALPPWFVPVGAVIIVTLAYRAQPGLRHVYFVAGLGLILAGINPNRTFKALILCLCGVVLVALDVFMPIGDVTNRKAAPVWTLWLLALALLGAILFFV